MKWRWKQFPWFTVLYFLDFTDYMVLIQALPELFISPNLSNVCQAFSPRDKNVAVKNFHKIPNDIWYEILIKYYSNNVLNFWLAFPMLARTFRLDIGIIGLRDYSQALSVSCGKLFSNWNWYYNYNYIDLDIRIRVKVLGLTQTEEVEIEPLEENIVIEKPQDEKVPIAT